jgi:hypothetical protein
MVMDFIKKHKLSLAVTIEAVFGHTYYVQVGSIHRTSTLASLPIYSPLQGVLMGNLFLDIFKKKLKKN